MLRPPAQQGHIRALSSEVSGTKSPLLRPSPARSQFVVGPLTFTPGVPSFLSLMPVAFFVFAVRVLPGVVVGIPHLLGGVALLATVPPTSPDSKFPKYSIIMESFQCLPNSLGASRGQHCCRSVWLSTADFNTRYPRSSSSEMPFSSADFRDRWLAGVNVAERVSALSACVVSFSFSPDKAAPFFGKAPAVDEVFS